MNLSFLLFSLFGFIAVFLMIEGLYLYWQDHKSPEMQRLQKRLRALKDPHYVPTEDSVWRAERVLSENLTLQSVLRRLPNITRLDAILIQAGDKRTVAQFLSLSLGLFFLSLLVLLIVLPIWKASLVFAIAIGCSPLMLLLRKRKQRFGLFEKQLPEAMDLLARSLRAGHAFSSAMQMVAQESPSPLSDEFRLTSDEIRYGTAADQALQNLNQRVPLPDLSYFVMAVIIQRETGGNLAELLGKLANLVRERFKLLAKVQALASEGKLSAIILSILPFGVAGALYAVNPQYLAPLFTDPAGVRMVLWSVGLMLVGFFVMSKMIDIKV